MYLERDKGKEKTDLNHFLDELAWIAVARLKEKGIRPAMECLNIELEGRRLCASDGHRIHFFERENAPKIPNGLYFYFKVAGGVILEPSNTKSRFPNYCRLVDCLDFPSQFSEERQDDQDILETSIFIEKFIRKSPTSLNMKYLLDAFKIPYGNTTCMWNGDFDPVAIQCENKRGFYISIVTPFRC